MANNNDIMKDDRNGRSPLLTDALLKDHTMSTPDRQRNIFWATRDYEHLGAGYAYFSPIQPEQITGGNGHIIMPRTMKTRDTQRGRCRGMAEVFTPAWICNAQNNLIDAAWFGRDDVFNHENGNHTWTTNPDRIKFPEGKTWRDYVRDTRMEITCGEAPYIASRYDAATGVPIAPADRIGLIDRKLRIVNENTDSPADWLHWTQIAFKSVYGYEWQGDSLFIARKNLLETFCEYYTDRFGKSPVQRSLLYMAYIISWNLWQMDGLKGVVPCSCGVKPSAQLTMFGGQEMLPCEGCRTGDIRRHNGKYCIIHDWSARPPRDRIRFIDLIEP